MYWFYNSDTNFQRFLLRICLCVVLQNLITYTKRIILMLMMVATEGVSKMTSQITYTHIFLRIFAPFIIFFNDSQPVWARSVHKDVAVSARKIVLVFFLLRHIQFYLPYAKIFIFYVYFISNLVCACVNSIAPFIISSSVTTKGGRGAQSHLNIYYVFIFVKASKKKTFFLIFSVVFFLLYFQVRMRMPKNK